MIQKSKTRVVRGSNARGETRSKKDAENAQEQQRCTHLQSSFRGVGLGRLGAEIASLSTGLAASLAWRYRRVDVSKWSSWSGRG